MNPAQELRDAAAKLRALATAATPGPWIQTGIGDYGWTVSFAPGSGIEADDSDQGLADANYIAAMHPGVGAALAAWLEEEAALHADDKAAQIGDGSGVMCENFPHALAVARQILGSQP